MAINNIPIIARECIQNNKINEVINVINSVSEGEDPWSGWAVYTDNQYTAQSPQVINSGQVARVQNNAGISQTDQLPINSTGLYDGTKVTPILDGDAYDLRVGFYAASSSNNGAFTVSIDISPTGNGSIIVSSQAIRAVRGAGQYQFYTIAHPIFTRATFLANGGRILVEAIDGSLSIYGASFVIVRTHKARV